MKEPLPLHVQQKGFEVLVSLTLVAATNNSSRHVRHQEMDAS